MQKYNEYVMTSLRTMWGCNLEKMKYEVRSTKYEVIRKRAESFVQEGLLKESSGVFFLTDEGKLFADRIAAELFWEE
jgi:oxygen-independent coproporphyrinogen-3 oxidase